MRKLIYLLVLTSVLFSCKKEGGDNGDLKGSWRLVSVYDKSTQATYSKPSGASGDIVITFSSTGFAGHTLRNTFSDGTYTLENGNQLRLGTFSMTQVMEEEWGSKFLTVLLSCQLQSLAPCAPVTVIRNGRTLKLDSPLRYTVTLARN